MMRTKMMIIIALLIPIVVLGFLTVYKKHLLTTGQEIILPISGYDPRDLLSGHFLIYTVDYGVKNLCLNQYNRTPAYICLDNKTVSFKEPSGCQLFIRGNCEYHRFVAGIEKFYIPETYAYPLEKEVRAKKASIVIMVPTYGTPVVKDLLIEGKSYRDFKIPPPSR